VIPASALSALPAAHRQELVDALKSSGTEARLRSVGMDKYLGPADVALPGVVFGCRLGRADGSISAELWYFESHQALTRAHRAFVAGQPGAAITSNGSFLVRFAAANPADAQSLSECVQAIAGEE
jgi:hypothetical protein